MSFVLTLLSYFCEALIVCIFIRSMMSWVSPNPANPIVNALFHITEPILAPLRRIVPRFGPADISPFVAVVILAIIWQILSFLR